MEVKNIPKTSGRKCDCCDTWKGHWEKMNNDKAKACSRKGCTNRATHGAHVIRRSTDSTWRIVPLCHECNNHRNTGWMELNKGIKTVSAEHYSCER